MNKNNLLLMIFSIAMTISMMSGCGGLSQNEILFEEFQRAVEGNSSEQLTAFLHSHQNVDYNKLILTYGQGWSPFYFLAQRNDIDNLKILLHYGLSPNLVSELSSGEKVPWSISETIKNPEMLRLILESGADANLPSYTEKSIEYPLFLAITTLLSGREINEILEINEDVGDSLFPKKEQLEKRKIYKSNIGRRDQAHRKSIALLIQYGADLDKGAIYVKDNSNCTPLIESCKIGRLDIIELLVNSGANVFLVDNHKTALDYCKKSKNFANETDKEKAINLLLTAMEKQKSQ